MSLDDKIRLFAEDEANEFFPIVADHMRGLLVSDPQLSLRRAYEFACHSLDHVQEILMARNRPRTQDPRYTATQRAAAAAKHTLRGPRGGEEKPREPQSAGTALHDVRRAVARQKGSQI